MDLEAHDWPDDPRYAPGRLRAHGAGPVRLVVLGDSFSYTDDRGPQLPGTPTSWPQVAADTLRTLVDRPVEVTVVARPATTATQGLAAVRTDQHVQYDVLAAADAVVVAIGSYDHAPMGVPAVVGAVLPHVRPHGLRRRVRAWLHRAYPLLVRATGARFARTPAATFATAYRELLTHVRGVAHGAAGVVVGPSSHRSAYYGWRHPLFDERAGLQLALGREQGFAGVPAWEHVLPHLDELNVDGIHWGRSTHRAVGEAVAAALAPQLAGTAPRPPRPGRAD